uniref:DUF3841 domain-containing protein n=1 Tax=Heterorhabditis bacteriophora TaxID=37862 RepID=A0A1I7WX90_HETBA
MASDVGKKVMVLADSGRKSIVRCGVSKYPIECIDEPTICENIMTWCQRDIPDGCFRLISYNILADLYLDLSGSQDKLFFPYCPKEYQSYEYRYPMILKELKGNLVICCHYFIFLKSHLSFIFCSCCFFK